MKQTLEEILQGKNVRIPMYDFRSHSRYVHVVEEGGREERRKGGREGGREGGSGREGRKEEREGKKGRREKSPHTCQEEGRETVREGGVDDRDH